MEQIDVKIQKLFDTIQQKKATIKKAEKASWQTNCSFARANSNERQNIQVLSDTNELVKILAYLQAEEKAFNDAADELGLKATYTHQSYTLDQWKSDIQTRITKLNIEQEKKTLNELESRLNAIISPEVKRQMELAEIEKLL